ncbi:hypothetical protein B0H14DRAFT_3442817 [Mycena olivaceomarginata]|nr:hypothetical protein B0H14DRAFT_3442817 [Mycena olivaceomarginata]
MSGNMTGEQSPEAMRLLGQITHSIYKDPLDDVHLETINHYYGVEGSRCWQRNGQTGAGQALDESSEEDEGEEVDVDEEEELENQIAAEQAQNICHAPVKVVRHGSPFPEDAEVQKTLRWSRTFSTFSKKFSLKPMCSHKITVFLRRNGTRRNIRSWR